MQALGVYLRAADGRRLRNIAFSRLNAFSYWIFTFGGVMIFVAFLLNTGPEAGWFSYVPLAGPQYSRRASDRDFWAQLDDVHRSWRRSSSPSSSSSPRSKLRAPGMTLSRDPAVRVGADRHVRSW